MGLLDFFKGPQTVRIGNEDAGWVEIDATLSEGHSISVAISKNPIEKGADLSDHARRQNDRINLTGVISEIPLDIIDSITNAGLTAVNQRVGGLGGTAVQLGGGVISGALLGGGDNRQGINLAKLEEFIDKSTQLQVRTKLKTYSDMMIESITIPKTKEIANSLEFNITLTKVRIVTARTVPVPESILKGGNAHSGSSKANLGKQKSTAASVQESERGASVLSNVFGVGA